MAARLEEIITQTRQVDESARRMNAASDRQQQGAAELRLAMEAIDGVTKDNAAMRRKAPAPPPNWRSRLTVCSGSCTT